MGCCREVRPSEKSFGYAYAEMQHLSNCVWFPLAEDALEHIENIINNLNTCAIRLRQEATPKVEKEEILKMDGYKFIDKKEISKPVLTEGKTRGNMKHFDNSQAPTISPDGPPSPQQGMEKLIYNAINLEKLIYDAVHMGMDRNYTAGEMTQLIMETIQL